LAPDGRIAGKVSFQKPMVYKRKSLGQPKGVRIICLSKIGGKLFIKKGEIKIDPLLNRINPHAGKIL
jgi:hypothetical protein